MLGSAQRNIQPTEPVDADAVAGIDQHRRGFGLDDGGAGQGMPRLQRIERIDRDLAPAAKERLPLADVLTFLP